jgi:predicted RNA-binding Zn-ribbon protein involved in translation (DUF1610 family)
MRDCPNCGKHELDVTGQNCVPKDNFIYRCWNCGFKISRKKLERIQNDN